MEENNTNLTAYHYSIEPRTEIKALQDQNLSKEDMSNVDKELIRRGMDNSELIQYKSEVNAFPFKLERKDIDKLARAGFWRWTEENLYCHEIDLEINASVITSIYIESNRAKTDFSQREKYDSSFMTRLKAYEEQEGFLVFNSIRELIKSGIVDKINAYTVDEYINLNIKTGQKQQYASSIPHFTIGTSSPLQVKTSYKI